MKAVWRTLFLLAVVATSTVGGYVPLDGVALLLAGIIAYQLVKAIVRLLLAMSVIVCGVGLVYLFLTPMSSVSVPVAICVLAMILGVVSGIGDSLLAYGFWLAACVSFVWGVAHKIRYSPV